MDEGKTHPVDTWDFGEGDIWFFPSNLVGSASCFSLSTTTHQVVVTRRIAAELVFRSLAV